MDPLFNKDTEATQKVLNAVAHIPTTSLDKLVAPKFWSKLQDQDYMRIAVYLAQKSYDEGGCPIGGVIIDNASKKIVGKGHNTLVQENDPYNHGETSAIKNAGRLDFSKTTIFTTLSPCDVCTSLIYMRGFNRVVVGDVTNASGNESLLESKGVNVEILEDTMGIELYKKYAEEHPSLNTEDWKGKAAL